MTTGPLQILVVEFDDPQFNGQIADELERLEDAGVLRVIDLAFVTKSHEGVIDAGMTHKVHSGAMVRLMLGIEGAVDAPQDDLDLYDAADAIRPGSAAAVVVLEHKWALPLRDAIRGAGGRATGSEWVDEEYLAKLGVTV